MSNENNAMEMAAVVSENAEQPAIQPGAEPAQTLGTAPAEIPQTENTTLPAAEPDPIPSAPAEHAPVEPAPGITPAPAEQPTGSEPAPAQGAETGAVPEGVPEQGPVSVPTPEPEPQNPPAPPQPKPREEESIFRPMGELPNDKEKGIENLAELNRLEVLRTEFASSTFKPKVILSYETISFNKACVELLPGTRYVNVLIDRSKKRIIILPVNRHAKDALLWCGVTPAGDVKKKVCTARKFGEKLFEMMEWVKENRYRILAYYQNVEGVQLLVFNLRECEMVVPGFVTTKTGKVIRRGKVYLPGDSEWNGFGMPREQHSKANEVELDAHYTLSDKDVDVTISDVKVRGKTPTDEEIIMSQYRKEKPQEVFVNA